MPDVNGVRFTFGSDPEGFVFDPRKKKYVSAHGKVPGTKQNPHRFIGGAVQVDGMAAEFNTLTCNFANDLKTYINYCYREIKQRWLYEYEFHFVPTAEFDDEEWDSAPEEAKILGCDPDYNAWSERINPVPDADGKQYRTGAGHIHIGWNAGMEIDDDLVRIGAALARELDATIGVASLLWDDDKKRRTLYGKAGAFRPKPYGMEYRTLSNVWVGKGRLTDYVANTATYAIQRLMNKKPIHTKEVRDIINKSKADDARHWLKEHNLFLPPY